MAETERTETGSGEAVRKPSPVQSLIGVFVNPRGTFEAMRSSPRFVLPIVVVLLVQIAISSLILRSGLVRDDTIAMMEAKGATPEEIERAEQILDMPVIRVLGVPSGVVLVTFLLLLAAGVGFFMGNLMLRAQLRYIHYLCVFAHASLIGVIDQIIRAVIALQKGTLDVRLGVGLLWGDEIGKLGRILDGLTDPLMIWQVAVTAVGLSALAQKGAGFGIVTALSGTLVFLLVTGFLR